MRIIINEAGKFPGGGDEMYSDVRRDGDCSDREGDAGCRRPCTAEHSWPWQDRVGVISSHKRWRRFIPVVGVLSRVSLVLSESVEDVAGVRV